MKTLFSRLSRPQIYNWNKYESSDEDTFAENDSLDGLLTGEASARQQQKDKRSRWLWVSSLGANVVLSITVAALLTRKPVDPSLGIYSPVNHLVEYHTANVSTGFMTKTPYMGFPTDEIDQMWRDLYSFGDSFITEAEANQLAYPTISQMGEKYIVQLEVFHQLHCLNDIRKAFYPERWPDKWTHKDDGTINRSTIQWRHWEHCIDILRGSLMCSADVSPISWRLNVPVGLVLAPQLETTHTCRNFTKIVEWAHEHEAADLRQILTEEERQDIIDNLPFDQSAWEDLSEFWPPFPGNKYFKQWQDGWNDTAEGRAFWAKWEAEHEASVLQDEFVDMHSH